MRTITNRIAALGAELVLIGSGSAQQAEEFLREQDASGLRVLVDPELKGYRAAALRRSLLAPYSPRGWWEGFKLWRKGWRPGKTAGDAYQLGGLFVISPNERVELAHHAASIYDRLPLEQVIATLERLRRESEPDEPVSIGPGAKAAPEGAADREAGE